LECTQSHPESRANSIATVQGRAFVIEIDLLEFLAFFAALLTYSLLFFYCFTLFLGLGLQIKHINGKGRKSFFPPSKNLPKKSQNREGVLTDLGPV
jgi:hypothetical protein